nr:rho GTPase-activating protein 20-like isoform X2 [Nyctereutes procyonoides]XP_055189505.1 rho GTPase-activating protein 20-like isoform X2 [Nyctereutes procyonoides]XP_055189506.1 rho GTPase-activating protein 20-like isoform X2 [Nyctereutes procyonoides]
MLLPMLRITGSEKDYQLWASSGKEEVPLIGHEHPYGIKMSHLPSTKLLPKEPEDSISPSTTQESLLEQKITEMQIQFMLKPRHPAQNKQGKDSGQKTTKSSAFGNLAFWRRAGTCQNNQCTAVPSAKPRQLFGVSLTDICENDNLPVPILDMLSFINRKGPLMEGIFRISGSRVSRRILKEKLSFEDRVNLDSESVLVVASVLKDFLRNIPGGIFSCDLYDKWLGVINEGTKEEKINAAQRLLAQLPKANVVLL